MRKGESKADPLVIVIGTRRFKYLELGSTFTQEQNKILSDQRTALTLEIAKALRLQKTRKQNGKP
jgi:hypothetical protein